MTTATVQTIDLKVDVRMVTCPDCNGAQEIRLSSGWCSCDRCDGTGSIPEEFVRITADDIRRLLGMPS